MKTKIVYINVASYFNEATKRCFEVVFVLFKVKSDKEICSWFQDEITNGEKLGFEVEYEGEDLVLEEESTFIFG